MSITLATLRRHLARVDHIEEQLIAIAHYQLTEPKIKNYNTIEEQKKLQEELKTLLDTPIDQLNPLSY